MNIHVQHILYYNVMIKQIMLYGSIVWSSCSIQNLQKVFRLQKRAARVILDANTRANSVELFNKLNWLPFYYEVKVNMCVLIYKCLNGQCPAYMRDIVRVNSESPLFYSPIFTCAIKHSNMKDKITMQG